MKLLKNQKASSDILRIKSEWEDGINMSSEELCKLSETKYKHLFEVGKWKFNSMVSGAEPKDKDK